MGCTGCLAAPAVAIQRRKLIMFYTCPCLKFENSYKIIYKLEKYEFNFVGIPSSGTTPFM
jgi:hypothetical protein